MIPSAGEGWSAGRFHTLLGAVETIATTLKKNVAPGSTVEDTHGETRKTHFSVGPRRSSSHSPCWKPYTLENQNPTNGKGKHG